LGAGLPRHASGRSRSPQSRCPRPRCVPRLRVLG
jgi:hypothetical protein